MLDNENELINQVNDLVSQKKYEEALELLTLNESLVYKKYYDVTKLKIEILIKLEKNIDALIIIQDELKVPYIPRDFEEFLLVSKRELNNRIKDKDRKSFSYDDISLLDKLDDAALVAIIPSINKFNLNGFEDVFQRILDNDIYTFFTKSLLIFALQDAKLNHEFKVIKDGLELRFNPSTMANYNDNFAYNYLNKKLSYVKDVPINILNQALQLAITYVFYVYPLLIDRQRADALACASICYALRLVNDKLENKEFLEFYNTNKLMVDTYIDKISKM